MNANKKLLIISAISCSIVLLFIIVFFVYIHVLEKNMVYLNNRQFKIYPSFITNRAWIIFNIFEVIIYVLSLFYILKIKSSITKKLLLFSILLISIALILQLLSDFYIVNYLKAFEKFTKVSDLSFYNGYLIYAFINISLVIFIIISLINVINKTKSGD